LKSCTIELAIEAVRGTGFKVGISCAELEELEIVAEGNNMSEVSEGKN
jgi:hypothetical protein